MFFGCFSGGARPKCSFSSKNKFFNEVTTRRKTPPYAVIPEEINILTLIYDDLASRNLLMRLTFDNFLSFFDLTGLWGAKLFESFDEDKQEVISFEEFLYGICKQRLTQLVRPRPPSNKRFACSIVSFRTKRTTGSSSKTSPKWYIMTDLAL